MSQLDEDAVWARVDELAERMSGVVTDLRDDPPPADPGSRRARSTTLQAFHRVIDHPQAVEALALLTAYAEAVDLHDSALWAVSAMPSTPGRISAITASQTDLFVVWESPDEADWGIRLRSFDEELPPLMAERCEVVEDGPGTYARGMGLASFVALTQDPASLEFIRELRAARRHKRRQDWHNPWLAGVICPDQTATDATTDLGDPLTGEEEITRRYYQRTTVQRGHQAAFRALLLRVHGPACHYCGLDIPAILEAAHLTPDHAGGAASAENGRILCANHHRAFDAGLLEWDQQDQVFRPAAGAPTVPPARVD